MTSVTQPRSPSTPLAAGPEHVVFAADDSFGAVAAASWLQERAAALPMTIEVAVVEGHVRAAQHHGTPHRIGEGVAWSMREHLQACIPGARLTVRTMTGDVASALRSAASDADLLVLGCNRNGFWKHLPVATRSTRIAEIAVRPTVVVPAHWTPRRGDVVAAVASHGGEAVTDWAASEAAAMGRPLVLVRGNLLPWSAGVTALPVDDTALLDEVDRRLLATLAARARAAHPGLDVRTELEHEGLVPGLVELGGTAAAIVIGTHQGGGPRLGSVLRGVLESPSCPVVVVPTGPVR